MAGCGARERWGDTPQWAQYAERAATRTPDDWKAISDAATALNDGLAQAMRAGVVPGSAEANRLAEQHRDAFSAYFPISQEMQVCLGRMYEADPEFAAHYNRVHPGLAAWLHRIIDANAEAHGIDPDSAT